MPIVKITGQGLSAIALAVALLWGCWIGERVTMHRAMVERERVLRDLRRLRHQPEPVSFPVPGMSPHRPATAG